MDGFELRRSESVKMRVSALPSKYKYLVDNTFIHSGYRVGFSGLECLKSMFHLHNETVNVWSHFLGFLLFISCTVELASEQGQWLRPLSGFTPAELTWTTLAGHQHFAVGGVHTSNLLACEVTPMGPRDLIEGPLEDGLYVRFASALHALQNRLSHARQQMSEGATHTVHELEATLRAMKDDFRTFRRNVAGNASEQLHALQDMVQNSMNTVVGAGKHKADEALTELTEWARSVLHSIQSLDIEAATVSRPGNPGVPRWPIFVLLAAGSVCLLFSAIFHLFGAMSEEWFGPLASLDYSGISLLITGSIVPLVYYGFYCEPTLMVVHMTLALSICAGSIIVLCTPKFRQLKYRTLRTVCFILAGTYGLVPLTHMLVVHGFDSKYHLNFVKELAITGAQYVIGGMIYLFRVPEKFFPGRFDYLLSSHQIFHCFVVKAALYHYFSVINHYEGRLPCQAA